MDSTEFTVLDLAGSEDQRYCWRRHAGWPSCKGLVFVLDAADSTRAAEAAECLRDVLSERPTACTIPLLVFANKQDLPDAMSQEEATAALRLPEVAGDHPFRVQPCCADDSTALQEGLVWLLDAMLAHRWATGVRDAVR